MAGVVYVESIKIREYKRRIIRKCIRDISNPNKRIRIREIRVVYLAEFIHASKHGWGLPVSMVTPVSMVLGIVTVTQTGSCPRDLESLSASSLLLLLLG